MKLFTEWDGWGEIKLLRQRSMGIGLFLTWGGSGWALRLYLGPLIISLIGGGS